MNLKSLYRSVACDFQAVNTEIFTHLRSQVPLVEQIGQYILDAGGKRVRPLLVLLSAQALNDAQSSVAVHRLAAAIEFLHTATLLHDDVVDSSQLRRGRPTANAHFGNASSVLVGDYLYSRAFELMVSLNNMKVMEILAHATATIAQGEVLQLCNIKNPDLSEEQYYQVIHGKTAMLFEASSHTAAVLLQAEAPIAEALRVYGANLGLAFQLVDDYLDYAGDAHQLGKHLGDDLAEGKPTLPLIRAMAVGTAAEVNVIRQAIRRGGLDEVEAVLEILDRTDALNYTRLQAIACIEQATTALVVVPQGEALDRLIAFAHMVVERDC